MMRLPSLSSLVVPTWLKLLWKIGPFIVIGLLSLTVHEKNWALHDLKQEDALAQAKRDDQYHTQQAGWEQGKSQALQDLAIKMSTRSITLETSLKDTRSYAQTPAGASACLPADRMRGIAALQQSLGQATSASSTDH